jgi:hypothetical protein
MYYVSQKEYGKIRPVVTATTKKQRLPYLLKHISTNLKAARADVLSTDSRLGIDGFGKCGTATTYLEGVLINMPLIKEVIFEDSKLKPLLAYITRSRVIVRIFLPAKSGLLSLDKMSEGMRRKL